jgi:hypothetical protein
MDPLVAQLRWILEPPEGRKPPKFGVKMYHILRFTTANPSIASYTGAIWCSDGVHFLTNTAILAKFLKLRRGRITQGFHDYAFDVLGAIRQDELDGLTDWAHWRKRRHAGGFSSQSTLQEAQGLESSLAKSRLSFARIGPP